MKRKKSRAIFLDRDGVINEDGGYVYKIDDFVFKSEIFNVLKKLQELGYILIIVTNQSGIGRGYYTKEDFLKLTSFMVEEFKTRGINIAKVYYCPHKPEDNCECRKPKNGMLEEAINEFNIDPKSSWMIGDKLSDIEAANRSGIENTILISEDKSQKTKFCTNSIYDIINIIKY